MTQDKELKSAIIVCTGPCSFDEAAGEALELAKCCEFVTLRHNSVELDINPDWSRAQLEAVWKVAAMPGGLRWRHYKLYGHCVDEMEVAQACAIDETLAGSIMARVNYLKRQS